MMDRDFHLKCLLAVIVLLCLTTIARADEYCVGANTRSIYDTSHLTIGGYYNLLDMQDGIYYYRMISYLYTEDYSCVSPESIGTSYNGMSGLAVVRSNGTGPCDPPYLFAQISNYVTDGPEFPCPSLPQPPVDGPIIGFPEGFNIEQLVGEYAAAALPFVSVACLLAAAFVILKAMRG